MYANFQMRIGASLPDCKILLKLFKSNHIQTFSHEFQAHLILFLPGSQAEVESIMSLSSKFYELRPIQLGCQVFGIDLKANISDEVKQVKKSSIGEFAQL